MGVSENRGPYSSTLNSRILTTRTPKMVPLIFGNSLMKADFFMVLNGGSWGFSLLEVTKEERFVPGLV